MDNVCTVTFEGTHGGTYTIPCDRAAFISSDNLVNGGSESFQAYENPNSDSNYIRFDALHYPSYRSNNTYNYTYITDATNIKFNNRAYFYRDYNYVVIFLLIICMFASLIRRTS